MVAQARASAHAPAARHRTKAVYARQHCGIPLRTNTTKGEAVNEPRAPHDERERLVELRHNYAAALDRDSQFLPGSELDDYVQSAALARLVDHFDRRIGAEPAAALQQEVMRLTRELAGLRQLAPVVDELLSAVRASGLTSEFWTGRWEALAAPIDKLDDLRRPPV